jgi:hypothetical protein
VSAVEVYNERAADLLAAGRVLPVRANPGDGFVAEGQARIVCDCPKDALSVLNAALKHR